MELNSWGEAPIYQCICAYVEFLLANDKQHFVMGFLPSLFAFRQLGIQDFVLLQVIAIVNFFICHLYAYI